MTNYKMLLRETASLTLVALLLVGCEIAVATPTPTPVPVPVATPYPTYTPVPTATPYPTYTPVPTYTPLPPTPTPTVIGTGEWVEGHFWSIVVTHVRTEAELDGVRPLEGVFVVVEVDWKANGLEEGHPMQGIDYELVDDTGKRYVAAGMIYRRTGDEPQGPGEKFNERMFRSVKAEGITRDTFKLVFDVPLSASGLKLWFQDLAPIDLGLEAIP